MSRPVAMDEAIERAWLRVAVIGAGPVGLSLALHAARSLPQASITLFDTRPEGVDVTRDPRTLALSLGSIQLLQRLKAWRPDAAEPITQVHVSQQSPGLAGVLADPVVRISAAEEGVDQLGAVVSYGAIVAPLETAWKAAQAREPRRLFSRFETTVSALENEGHQGNAHVRLASRRSSDESSAELLERFDLAIVAEGGVFAEQSRKAVQHDYRQTAWVGKVTLASSVRGRAFERFTHSGPAALLPLPPLPPEHASVMAASKIASIAGASTALALATGAATHAAGRAALVWCVPTDDDPVRGLNDEQRVAVLNTVFHPEVGEITSIGPLKSFALGLNAERTLTERRVVRIGNAAQTLHPVAGQGLNLGMRDAFELVMRLARGGNDVDAALRRIEWSRAPDRWAMIAATDFLARSFTWQLPGLATARAVALAGLQFASPIKSLVARQMMFGRR